MVPITPGLGQKRKADTVGFSLHSHILIRSIRPGQHFYPGQSFLIYLLVLGIEIRVLRMDQFFFYSNTFQFPFVFEMGTHRIHIKLCISFFLIVSFNIFSCFQKKCDGTISVMINMRDMIKIDDLKRSFCFCKIHNLFRG